MKHGILIIFMLGTSLAAAQPPDTLSLERVQALAIEHYPLLKQDKLFRKGNALSKANIKASYLPQLSLNGQASYQSEVVQLPFSVPGVEVPELPQERWQVSLDVNQPIYSGGSRTIRQTIENQQLDIDLQQQQISIQQLKPMVQQHFFFSTLIPAIGRNTAQFQTDA